MTFLSNNGPKTYVIVDNYKTKTMDIDADAIADLSHGEVVEKMLLSKHPDAKIIRYDVAGGKKELDGDTKKIEDAFDDISKRIDSGEKIDGVNFSFADNKKISTISKCVKGQICNDNISEKESTVKSSIYSKLNSPSEAIESIEKVTSKNVPVYMSAGNDGPEYYNMFGLAKGVTQVGALNAKGEKSRYSSNNSDVQKWAQGDFEVSFLKNDSGKIIGYDYTGDGKMDLSADQSSTKGLVENMFGTDQDINGTSFASPLALGLDT